MRISNALLLVALAQACGACDSTEFAPRELVDKDRPLAGRVSVEGDPTRTTPAPGERASYELLVVSPAIQRTWSYRLVVCHLERRDNGIALCDPALPPIATSVEGATAMAPAENPSLTFEVPELVSLRPKENTLLVQGLLCPGPLDPVLVEAFAEGELAQLVADPNPCADKSRNGLIISAPFALELSEFDRNHAPLITKTWWSARPSASPVEAGTPWSRAATAETPAKGCVGQGFDEVQAAKDKPIGLQIALDDTSRESYIEPSPIPGEQGKARTEIPSVEGFASTGEFEIVRDNQRTLGQLLQLEWKPPKPPIAKDGELVRFWFVAADDRLGSAQATSWIERALCILPSP